jgi:phytoene dehydrogenase-like protein
VDTDAAEQIRIVVIGAGFAGLGMAVRLKQAGIDDFVILERAEDVGGTWRDNSYPGCAVDVQSHLYSFSFAPNPNWSQVYAPQREIWAYHLDPDGGTSVLWPGFTGRFRKALKTFDPTDYDFVVGAPAEPSAVAS